jgi:hypothetical protein
MSKKWKGTLPVIWKVLDDGRYYMNCPFLHRVDAFADTFDEVQCLVQKRAVDYLTEQCNDEYRDYFLAPLDRGIINISIDELMDNGRNGLFKLDETEKESTENEEEDIPIGVLKEILDYAGIAVGELDNWEEENS